MRAILLSVGLAGLAFTGSAQAQGIDQTCLMALAKYDPATANIAFPDDSAQYYVGAYAAIPGTRVRISGRFPHARYMSFNVYDPATRTLEGISDVEIRPDPGSLNPFAEGADRTATHRSYTVFIESGQRPANPAPNTLYAGRGQNGEPNVGGTFVYRIYVPDRGRDEAGGVGLPTATIEPAGTSSRPPRSICADVVKPALNGVNELIAGLEPPLDLPLPGGSNPPAWRKFVNLASSVSINLLGTPKPLGIDLDALGGGGGLLANRDNAYVSAPVSRAHGPIVVTRLRAPSFPDTRPPSATTMGGGQLRYWSICQNDPPTTRMVACVNDDRAVVTQRERAGGFATFVVSTPSRRPRSATRACGVNWLPWGPNPRGVLIYRHMLARPSFGQSVQAAKVDREAATMGDYLPVSRYYASAAAYERAVGC